MSLVGSTDLENWDFYHKTTCEYSERINFLYKFPWFLTKSRDGTEDLHIGGLFEKLWGINLGRIIEVPVRVNRERWRVHMKVCHQSAFLVWPLEFDSIETFWEINRIFFKLPAKDLQGEIFCHLLFESILGWVSKECLLFLSWSCVHAMLSLSTVSCQSVGKTLKGCRNHMECVEPRHCHHNWRQIL